MCVYVYIYIYTYICIYIYICTQKRASRTFRTAHPPEAAASRQAGHSLFVKVYDYDFTNYMFKSRLALCQTKPLFSFELIWCLNKPMF